MDHTRVSGDNVAKTFKPSPKAWPKPLITRYPKTSIFIGMTVATSLALVITGLIGTYGHHGLFFEDLTQLNWKVYVSGAATFVGLTLALSIVDPEVKTTFFTQMSYDLLF